MSIVPFEVQANTIYAWDALTTARTMRACGFRVNCVVTSPPYFGLRDYGVDEQIGKERTPDEYVQALVGVFRVIRDVLTDDGSVWLNIGDSYNGSGKGWTGHNGIGNQEKRQGFRAKPTAVDGLKSKDLIGVPWLLAFALQADGWYLRSDIIWSKPNPMPESVRDRPTKSHEYVFLLTKSQHYYYNADAIKTPVKPASIKRQGRAVSDTHKNHNGAPGQTPHSMFRARANVNKQDGAGNRRYTGFNERYDGADTPMANARTVWEINTMGFPGAHFAVMPEKLVEPCVLAGCPVGGVVYDPFMGSGTVALVSRRHGRQYVGSEINPEYVAIARQRLRMPFEQHYVKQNNDVSDLPLFAAQEQPA